MNIRADSKSTPTMPRRQRFGWRILLALGAVIVTLLLSEAVVRIFKLGSPVYASRRFEPNGAVPFTRIPNGPISYVPGSTFSSVYDPAGDTRGYFGPEGRVTYRINSFGMRGKAVDVAKTANSFRVICLGDSLTFGEGVKEEDTYPVRLEATLSGAMPNRRVEVLNAGVQAYGTMDEAAFFLLRGAQFHPDVVTLGFFLNDVTDGALTIQQNDARTKGLELSSLGRISRLWEIFERGRWAGHMQEEFFRTTRESFSSKRWEDAKALLKEMQRISQEDHFRFVVVIFPILWDLDGDYPMADIHAQISAACREAGCEYIDMLDVYRGRPAQSLWVHPTDQHPNETAHRLAAERIAEFLKKPR